MPGLLILIFCVLGYAAFCPGDTRLPLIAGGAAVIGALYVGASLIERFLIAHFRLARHGQRLKKLEAFAAELTRASSDGVGFYSGGTTSIAGRFDGRLLELVLRLGVRPTIALEVRLEDSKLELEAVRPFALARWLGAGPLVARFKGTPGSDVEAALRHLVLDRKFERVRVAADRVWVEKTFVERDLDRERLLDVSRTLGRIASAATRGARSSSRLQPVRVETTERRCPWCHGTLDVDEVQAIACTRCGTWHHEPCFLEAGGCTVFACPGAPRRRGRAGRDAKSA